MQIVILCSIHKQFGLALPITMFSNVPGASQNKSDTSAIYYELDYESQAGMRMALEKFPHAHNPSYTEGLSDYQK